ncbi:hypothetical protein [Calidifontibacter terrae]
MSKRLNIALAAVALTAGASVPAMAMNSHSPAPKSQRFVMSYVTVGDHDEPVRVTAAGPIHGEGTVLNTPVKETKNGAVIKTVLTFPGGTVQLQAVEKAGLKIDRDSCTAQNLGTGTWVIVSGTGAYANAHGKGTFVRRVYLVGAFDQQARCLGESAQPVASIGTLVVDGRATGVR